MIIYFQQHEIAGMNRINTAKHLRELRNSKIILTKMEENNMSENNNVVLNSEMVLDMFQKLGVSIAVIDENMNMIYMNERAEWFYEHVFHAKNLLGKNVEFCHEPIHVANIKKLMEVFKTENKPLNFFNVEIPIIEGGHLTVVHFPYYKDEKFIGIMEVNIESSLIEGGRGEYRRAFDKL